MTAPAPLPNFARGDSLAARLKAKALEFGFDVCRIAPPSRRSAQPTDWRAGWSLAVTATWRGWRPPAIVAATRARSGPEARACVMVGDELRPDSRSAGVDAATRRRRPFRSTRGIAIITTSSRARLKQLGGWFVANAGGDVKVFVDTAPVMEKPLAAGRGARLAGQAHQPRQPRVRLLAVSRRACSPTVELPPDAARDTIIAAPAAPASTPARPRLSSRPINWTLDAAFPI